MESIGGPYPSGWWLDVLKVARVVEVVDVDMGGYGMRLLQMMTKPLAHRKFKPIVRAVY